MANSSFQQIQQLLSRRVAEVIVRKNLEQRLLAGEKLRVKLGIDPTGSDIHIGHMVLFHKLREFQKLDHQIVIIIGDYTARIGDPSGKDKMREPLSVENIQENLKTYKKQIGKVLDLDKTEFRPQSEWFDKISLAQVLELAGIFTMKKMLDRDMYQRRMKDDMPIGLHEFMYPLMQGYDSVAVKSDLELGGTDQTFNLLAGRDIQAHHKQKPQDILTAPLLLGLDGRKMGKTYNNYIGVMEEPSQMFGKIMSAIDDVIIHYFEIATDVPQKEIDEIKELLAQDKVNPRDLKAKLAREIVTIYHSKDKAQKAEQEFERIFRDHQAPSEIIEIKFELSQKINLVDLLVKTKLASSKGEARRLIEQGGVKIDGEVQENVQAKIKIKDGMVVQKGKRGFVRLKAVE